MAISSLYNICISPPFHNVRICMLNFSSLLILLYKAKNFNTVFSFIIGNGDEEAEVGKEDEKTEKLHVHGGDTQAQADDEAFVEGGQHEQNPSDEENDISEGGEEEEEEIVEDKEYIDFSSGEIITSEFMEEAGVVVYKVGKELEKELIGEESF